MIVTRLELTDYRNYKSLELEFSDGSNILYGNNAQGKTNILEAVYLCGTTKSHRGSKDKELIRLAEKEAHVRVYLKKNGIDYRVDLHLSHEKRKAIAIDGVPVKKYSELFSLICVVSFSPEDLAIVKNGPAERRHFCDMELCQLDKIYMFHLANYNKALVQRNMLLRNMSGDSGMQDMLNIWNDQLISNGVKIISLRAQFIEEIGKLAKEIHSRLTNNEEELILLYEPEVREEEFSDKLVHMTGRDIAAKMTTVGPHRDDICFQIVKDGKEPQDVRRYGSQGQQRTCALSLKLAEIELVKQKIKDDPIILLDDVLSELDRNRQKQLLDSIEGMQTILTCTGLEEFVNCRKEENRTFYVENGTVTTFTENGGKYE